MSANEIFDTATVNSNAVHWEALDLVGFEFNPSGDSNVRRAKLLSAELISMMITIRESEGVTTAKAALASLAIGTIITAQMWAVKVITWRK